MKLYVPIKIIHIIDILFDIYYNVEVGGVLLGEKNDEGYKLTNVVYNLENKNLYAGHFNRTIDDIADEISEIIVNSGYKVNYIGEWHTHPKNISSFSLKDKNSILELTDDFQELILLIRGEDGYSAYMCDNSRFSNMELITEG